MIDNFQRKLKAEQEKSKFLLDIINSIPEPIMAKDRHGKFIFANKALADFYNTTPNQMIGKDDAYFTDDIEQTKLFTESVQAIIKSKKSQGVYEDATDTKTGETHSFYSLKTPFINHKGEDNVVIIATNITDIITLKNQAEKNEKMLASVLDISSEGMWEWNTQTNDVFHNKAWEIITGVIDIENSFEEFQRCIFEKDTAQVNEALRKLLEENIPYSIEYRMVRPSDGKKIWIWDRGVVLEHNEQGKPLWVVGIIQDITERKNAEEKITLAASVFTHARESIVITDADGTILDINDTFLNTTGYSREEIIGTNPRILQSGRQPPEFYIDMWQALLKEGHWSGEIWNRRKNGEVYAEIKTISAVCNEQGITTHYVALGNDITPIKKHQEQLERIANYDILTNLPNRVLLSDRLSQAMLQCSRHEKSLAVVFLDLDGFKAINDTHGHDVGDELLVVLSARMQEALREGDSLARIGGDEFVAVLDDLAKVEDCEPVLERLLLAASQPITIDNIVLKVSASIGVTLYPQDNVDADLLLRHADQAMYVAKELGKNRYHLFDTAQDDAVKVQRESLEAIRIALDNHQFVLYYQPKVNMRTGSVVGVEALIRWQHPERGLLNPIEFLPVIENSPMSIELGEWVIDRALTQISQWQAMGIKLHVSTSVNIAAVQLQQPDFTDKLAALLAAHPDVEPRYLELEVLETSALDDIHDVSTIMHDCIALGVKFALDDFGTGYSSLTYLRRLPASLIKIDQTFVRDMLNDPDDLAIVEGVIVLAKSFKRDVIAEGVETIEHGTALLQLGCELAQGYGIARPMPADDIPAWVNDWKPNASWQS
jgi:diguanylate cyclase (GGDEF)-like protein/PAS domain S-box-containing protein